MKKLLLLAVALSLLALALPPAVRGQEPIWLPIVVSGYCGEEPTMSFWKIVVPENTRNLCLNPSAEIAGNFAAVGGSATRVTTYSKWGLYSYRVQTAADNQGATFTLSALANAVHYATVRVRGTLPPYWDWSLDGGNWHEPTLIEALDADWSLYGCQFPAAEANGSTTLRVYQDGAGAGDFYLDGVQVEAKSYWTTYCDGTQDGCEWLGAEHASTSSRSAQSRAGGRVRDLETDYSFDVGGMTGAGMAPQSLAASEYAILPGGEVSGAKTHMHPFVLTGVIRGTSYADLHAKRQALVLLFDPDGVPEDEDGPQPVRLRYTGATVQKEIAVHYEAGLEGKIRATDPCWWENVAVRFLADDPFWYEIGESAAALDSAGNVYDSATFRIVAGRLRSTGQWDALGPPAAPGIAAYTSIQTIAVGQDGMIYVGGEFSNFDNDPSADQIAQYNPFTGTWSAMADGLNGIVHDIAVAPDGDLYIVGEFDTSGTGAPNTYPYVVRWDVSAGTWAAVDVGLDGVGLGVTVGPDGNIYIVGSFTDIFGGGGGTYNRVIQWNPITTAWSALGTGLSDPGQCIAVQPNGKLVVGGQFTTAGGGAANRVAEWDISAATWSALGSGFANATVLALAVSGNGVIYAGGSFTKAGGSVANYLAMYRGVAWEAFPVEPNNIVYSLEITPDGLLYVGGAFTQIDSATLPDRIVKWNGSSFAHLDINLPGVATVFAITHTRPDPVIPPNYDLYLGFHTSGTGYYGSLATVTNDGTETAYPKIIIGRSGGTSATLETVRNETTGKELLYDYDLLDEETLTTDLTPTQKSIVSNFWGDRMDAILRGCDFGTWALQPGANQVTAFVAEGGAVTVTAYLLWQDKYDGYD